MRYAYRSCKTDHHPVGTCAMGNGPEAVVTPDLRVRGIDGLRVVDASVMPFVPLLQHQRADHHGGGEGRRRDIGRAPPPAAVL